MDMSGVLVIVSGKDRERNEECVVYNSLKDLPKLPVEHKKAARPQDDRAAAPVFKGAPLKLDHSEGAFTRG